MKGRVRMKASSLVVTEPDRLFIDQLNPQRRGVKGSSERQSTYIQLIQSRLAFYM